MTGGCDLDAVGGGALIIEGVGDGNFTGVGIDGEEAAGV